MSLFILLGVGVKIFFLKEKDEEVVVGEVLVFFFLILLPFVVLGVTAAGLGLNFTDTDDADDER